MVLDSEVVELIKEIHDTVDAWVKEIDKQVCFMVKEGMAQSLVKHKLVAIQAKLNTIKNETEVFLRMLRK